ncbi:TonB-dependent receptor [Sphingomonas sp. HF-S4]|uniref:TonB-dependent receptor n=1 Tax=Sphingomonas agrestis TaxID=3080540 RepID=A0ABU3Y988_9SPHN|nr:TonB-dependent receptor [Sphingomonas sp. HF-S4]MDV3457921.1 TonB-dependent receptor [Sphingomonas sp. HF-S4]
MRKGIRVRNSVSFAAMAAAFVLSPAALAQDAPADPVDQSADSVDQAAEGDNDTIIVTGTRASLQSAIGRKKNSGTVVDSIVADDIASFPDKNVGEALSRITGVQLSREFGEGTQVSIRGVEPDLNRVQINGVSQQSATGGRGGDFRELAVELVKSIDVYKGYMVDLPEGGIGGTVSVETRRPLDLKDPIFSIKAEGQRLDLTETWQPRLNFLAGRGDLLDGRFGFIVNVTHSAVDTRSDFAANTNWKRIADFDRSTEKTIANSAYSGFNTYESCAGVTGATAAVATANRLACETQFFDWAPTIYRYRSLDRRDYRTSVDLQAQFRPTDNFNFWVQGQMNKRRQQLRDINYSINADRFERYNYDAALPANAAGATSRPRITNGTFTIEDHVVTSSTLALNGVNVGTASAPNYNGANSIVSVQRRNFDYDQFTQYYQTGFDWDLDRLKVRGLGAYSKAQLINNTNLVALSTGVGGITVDRRNELGLPVFGFPSSFDPANAADYGVARNGANGQALVQAGPTVQYRPSDEGSNEKLAQLDMDYELGWGPFTTIEWGGQFRDQRYFRYQGGGGRLLQAAVPAVPAAGIVGSPAVFQSTANVSYNTVIGPVPASGPAADTYYWTQAQYQAFLAQTGVVNGGSPLFTGLQGAPSGAPSRIGFAEFAPELGNYYDLSRFTQALVRNANGLPQIPAYVIDEQIASAYLKANFEQELLGMKLTGNVGVRYTKTRDRAMGTNRRNEIRIRPGTGVPGIPAVTETVQALTQEITIENKYEDWLPAVNLNLEVVPNLFVRGTYAKNMARPKPTDLAPAINCTIDTLDALGVDDTCVAGNPDLQPYRADQFDVNASWYPNRDTLVSVGYYYKDIKSFIVPNVTRAGVDLYHDGTTYTVRQPVNAFGAKLDGIEVSAQTVFSFLPAPFDGFGAGGNFTFARVLNSGLINQSTGEALDGYPGLSKYTYNGSLFYDKGFLNARISYNRRSDWLAAASDANFDNSPIFRKGETFIDAKVMFRLTDKYSVWVEGLNLGKEYSQTYIDATKPVEYNYPGQRIFVGMQWKL